MVQTMMGLHSPIFKCPRADGVIRQYTLRTPGGCHQPPDSISFTFTQDMQTFKQTVLYTALSGEAKFKEDSIALDQGKPQALLSSLMPSAGYQLRHSPVGFESEFHCTTTPQWVFILGGEMEIVLHSGESRIFKPGEHFYSTDTPPPGVAFDPLRHGHRSRQVGPHPLVTLFLRGEPTQA